MAPTVHVDVSQGEWLYFEVGTLVATPNVANMERALQQIVVTLSCHVEHTIYSVRV